MNKLPQCNDPQIWENDIIDSVVFYYFNLKALHNK